jgi:hypothetical protein
VNFALGQIQCCDPVAAKSPPLGREDNNENKVSISLDAAAARSRVSRLSKPNFCSQPGCAFSPGFSIQK